MAVDKTIESKGSKAALKPLKKLCIKCSKTKDIKDFYTNKDWVLQLGYDAWCKDCVNKSSNKDLVKEYFWLNNRLWNENIWGSARKKAEALVANNPTYQKLNNELRKQSILDRVTAQQIPSVMTLNYKFVDNSKTGMTYAQSKLGMSLELKADPSQKIFSKEFNGWFKSLELEYLQNYYEGLEEDYLIDTQNHKDYARKLCKASLQADIAQNNFAMGKVDFSVVKDAMAQFDMLAKSANFAACKRKEKQNDGFSWSLIALKLETTGHPCTKKILWLKDDVDRTIEEFKYIVESLGLDTI